MLRISPVAYRIGAELYPGLNPGEEDDIGQLDGQELEDELDEEEDGGGGGGGGELDELDEL